MANPQYNRIIRKLITGFGNLFNTITLVRYNPDESEQERIIVPIAYAQKEKYVQRLEGDPNLDKKVHMTLPRMSYEMTGLKYDETRKQNTNFKNFVNTPGGVLSQYNPVPYNFDFNLYIYVRNIEDGSQIIEYILPYFTPDYTIKLNLIPEMAQVKEIPIVLNSTEHEIQYEGARDSDPRMVIWTLNFTVKGYVFGATTTSGLITKSITNILTNTEDGTNVKFLMNAGGTGQYKLGEIVYQGYTLGTALATELFVGALAIRVVPEYSVTVSPLGTDGVTVAVNVIGVPTGQVTLFPLGSEDFKETEVAVVANAVEPENKTTRQKRVNR